MTILRVLTRRAFTEAAGLAPLALAFGRPGPAIAQGKEAVKFLLDWTWWPPHIPIMVAKKKGIFDNAGLDIELRQGTGSGNTCQLVGQGTFEVGTVNLTTAAQYIAKGAPIKAVANMAPKGASALVFKAGLLKKAQDVIGKRIGSTPGGSDAQILPAFFAKNAIDPAQVKIVNMPGDAKFGALLSDQIDMLSGDGYYYVGLAGEKGVKLDQLLFADFGANTIGQGLVANLDYIKNRPETLRRFVGAVLQGYKYAAEHVDESVKIYKEISSSEQSDDTVRSLLREHLALIASGASQVPSFGYNSKEIWGGTLDILGKYAGLPPGKPVEEYFTNDFLPRA